MPFTSSSAVRSQLGAVTGGFSSRCSPQLQLGGPTKFFGLDLVPGSAHGAELQDQWSEASQELLDCHSLLQSKLCFPSSSQQSLSHHHSLIFTCFLLFLLPQPGSSSTQWPPQHHGHHPSASGIVSHSLKLGVEWEEGGNRARFLGEWQPQAPAHAPFQTSNPTLLWHTAGKALPRLCWDRKVDFKDSLAKIYRAV